MGDNACEIALKMNKNSLSLRTIWCFFKEALSENKQRDLLRSMIEKYLDLIMKADEKMFNEFMEIVRAKFRMRTRYKILQNHLMNPLQLILITFFYNKYLQLEEYETM